MSAGSYAATDTEALIEEFVRMAKLARNMFTLKEPPAATPERMARLLEIRAIGAELRARAPIEKGRTLGLKLLADLSLVHRLAA